MHRRSSKRPHLDLPLQGLAPTEQNMARSPSQQRIQVRLRHPPKAELESPRNPPLQPLKARPPPLLALACCQAVDVLARRDKDPHDRPAGNVQHLRVEQGLNDGEVVAADTPGQRRILRVPQRGETRNARPASDARLAPARQHGLGESGTDVDEPRRQPPRQPDQPGDAPAARQEGKRAQATGSVVRGVAGRKDQPALLLAEAGDGVQVARELQRHLSRRRDGDAEACTDRLREAVEADARGQAV
ncbi:hypothetical protein AK830_g1988 [Neonectria ditissima]|uniref:Uncharacterized protein n=1 Tax=Neonectria ditissima TaxID=78410 RepID=A0A0P7BSZ8_9HYPO|nr:hypothetical protein AK830_g1988 [Neonectria ditissima]